MKKRYVVFVASLFLSAGFLWFALRGVDFRDLYAKSLTIHWIWLVPSQALFWAQMYLRTVRWGLFFPPDRPVSTRRLFSPNMICYALNSLFPFRVGEAARAVLVGRREEVSIATALATVAAERVVDSLTILAGLALVFVLVPFGNVEMQYHGFKVDPETLKAVARNTALYAVLPLVVGILLMMNAAFRRLVERLIDAMGFLPRFLRNAARRVIEAFALGFNSLKSPSRVLWIAIHSVLIWALVAGSVQLLGYAFDTPLTFLQGLTIVLLICVTILIPAAPGYWGLWEAGFLLAVTLMGLTADRSTLVAMALLAHLTQYAPVILVGVVCAGVSGISLREARHTAETAEAVKEVAPAAK